MRTKSFKPISYRVGWLASFLGSRSNYNSLSLVDDGIVLVGGQSASNKISYLAISPDITVEQGFFWNALVIPLENGDSLRFSGVAKKKVGQLQATLNQQCRSYIEAFYQRLVPDLQQAYQQGSSFVFQSTLHSLCGCTELAYQSLTLIERNKS